MFDRSFFESDFSNQVDAMNGTPTVSVLTVMGEHYNVSSIVCLADTCAIFAVYPKAGVSKTEKEKRKPLDKVIWDRVVIPYQQIARVFLTVEDSSGSIGFGAS